MLIRNTRNQLPGPTGATRTQGNTFQLNNDGLYILDYETSLTATGSISIYTGANIDSLTIDNNTITGSAASAAWIHGRAADIYMVQLIF